MGAVGQHLIQRRPRQQPAFGPGMPLADRLVIGVEQIAEGRIEGPVAALFRLQQEGLEEPGDVGQVPFGGADVRHGLDLLVLGAEAGCEPQAFAPHRRETTTPRVPLVRSRRRSGERRYICRHARPSVDRTRRDEARRPPAPGTHQSRTGSAIRRTKGERLVAQEARRGQASLQLGRRGAGCMRVRRDRGSGFRVSHDGVAAIVAGARPSVGA